jgi:hypothetical protein
MSNDEKETPSVTPFYRIPRRVMAGLADATECLNTYMGQRSGNDPIQIYLQKQGELFEIQFRDTRGYTIWVIRMGVDNG